MAKIIVDDIELTPDIFNVVFLFGISRALSASSAPITADVCNKVRIRIQIELKIKYRKYYSKR